MEVIRYTDRPMNVWMKAARSAALASKCAKMKVGCVLSVDEDDMKPVSIGYNNASMPDGSTCPRTYVDSGKMYGLCEQFCFQDFHAETMAIHNWKTAIAYTTFYPTVAHIYGHDRVCDDCMKQLTAIGVKKIYLRKE